MHTLTCIPCMTYEDTAADGELRLVAAAAPATSDAAAYRLGPIFGSVVPGITFGSVHTGEAWHVVKLRPDGIECVTRRCGRGAQCPAAHHLAAHVAADPQLIERAPARGRDS